jgi:DNA-binding IscR family transcriptional regulator
MAQGVVLAYLVNNPTKWFTSKVLAERTGISRNTLRHQLNQLYRYGEVVRMVDGSRGRGVYYYKALVVE